MELRGKTVLITRAASQSEGLRDGLVQLGARVVECPAIEFVPVEDWAAVDSAIASLDSYDWLILTSTNAVNRFMQRVAAVGKTCSIPIAVVGPATACELNDWNLAPSLTPADFRAEGLLEMFPAHLHGKRILFPSAETIRDLLPEELKRRGAHVDRIPVYRTVKSKTGLANLRNTLSTEKVDCVVFTSPSAIRFFAETLGDELTTLLKPVMIATIGPVARQAVESLGLKSAIQPDRATMPDLIEAIRVYFGSRKG